MRGLLKKYADNPNAPGYARPVSDDVLALASPGASLRGVDTRAMSVDVCFTTPAEDREGDVVDPLLIDLGNYRLNPAVVWDHQLCPEIPLPVAKAEDPQGNCTVRLTPEGGYSRNYFSQSYPPAVQIFALIAEGILRGISFGFNPIDAPQRRRGERKSGHKFGRVELLEVTHACLGMNAQAGVIRSLLQKGTVPGAGRLLPSVRKALSPHAAPRRAFLFTGESPVKKAMTESSGVSGGYAVPEDMPEEHKAVCKAVAEVGAEHLPAGEGHELHVHPESGEVHHSYHEQTDPADHAEMRKALWETDGVRDVEHGPHPGPEGDGWVKVFPGGGEEEGGGEKPGVKSARGRRKSYGIGAIRKALGRISRPARRAFLKALDADGMGGVDDGVGDGADLAPAEEDAEVEAGRDEVRHGAQVIQHTLEFLEGELPLIDNPGLAEFVRESIAEWRDKGKEDYPDVDFGGEAEPEPDADASAAETAADVDEYASPPAVKSYSPRQLKRMSKKACAVIKDASEHLGDLADMPPGSKWMQSHQKNCKAHHEALVGLHKAMSGLGDGDDDADDPVMKSKMDNVARAAYEAFGRRI